MEDGVTGQITVIVARPVVKGRKREPENVTTRIPQEVERTVMEKPQTPRNVTLENVNVRYGDYQF